MAGGGAQFIIDLQARFQQLTPANKALASLEKQILKSRESVAKLEAKLATATPKQAAGIMKLLDAERANLGALEASLPAWRAFSEASNVAGLDVAALGGHMAMVSKVAMALVVAIVAAAAAFVYFGLTAADAARSTMLLDVAAAGGAVAGAELNAVVSQLARRIPIAREKLNEMAKSLIDARLAGLDMQNALTAIATVASAKGQQAANAIDAIAKSSASMRRFMLGARDVRGEFVSLAGTGIKAKDVYNAVAKTLGITVAAAQAKVLSGAISLKKGMEILATVAKDKFGATIGAQMLSLSNQVEKARENFKALFGGVNIDKFLVGLAMVTDLLSQDTFTGYALKEILTATMNGFFDAAAVAMPYVRAGLIGIAIGALVVFLAFLKVKKAITSAFKDSGVGKIMGDIDGIKAAMYVGIGIVGALAAIFTVLAAAMFIAAVPLGILVVLLAGLVAIPLLIAYAFYSGFQRVKAAIEDALGPLENLSLSEIGAKAIDSLISGIKSKAGALSDAVAAIASLIPGGISTALVMHSPSVLLTNQGKQAISSFSSGAESQADDVAAAGRRAGNALSSGTGGAGGSGNGKMLRGPIQIGPFYVASEELVSKIRETVLDLIEQEAGASPEPA